MTAVRIESVAEPFASTADLARDAATLVARAEIMGFLPSGADTRVLDIRLLELVLERLADRRVAVRAWPPSGRDEAALRKAVGRALEQSEHSPMPDGEWPSLTSRLGDELLGGLLGISPASLRRYRTAARPTPQDVADRLHVLALIVADLTGGYNDYGTRRWFVRPRAALDGRPPAALLGKGWDPDGADALRVRGLAASLVGSGAA